MQMSVACRECECTCPRMKCTAHRAAQHSAGACPWSRQGPCVSGPAPSPQVNHCFLSSWGWASSSRLGQDPNPGSGRRGAGVRARPAARLFPSPGRSVIHAFSRVPRCTLYSEPEPGSGPCLSRQSLLAPQAAPPWTALGSLENWVSKSGLLCPSPHPSTF